MTFDDIVSRVMDKLNLSSTDATTRIGERVNEVYKAVTSGIGLYTSRLTEFSVEYDPTDVTLNLPEIVVDGVEKLMTVRLQVTGNVPKILEERTYEDIVDLQAEPPHSQDPQAYAIKRMGNQNVTIVIDAFPETDLFTLEYEGYELADDLADDAEPAFAESFHDVLIHGAVAEELLKMEKASLAGIAQQKYEKRLSDLRFFIAKSQWLDVVQGKVKRKHIRGATVINDG